MVQFIEVPQISGVTLVELKPVDDSRGRFREIFRKEWFPESSWKAVQSNHSLSNEGVLRGLHFHKKQSDYWYILDGQIRVGLVDLRRNSKTFKACLTLDMKQNEPRGLFIPVGVAHGFLAVKKTNLLYIVDNYYDGDDEYATVTLYGSNGEFFWQGPLTTAVVTYDNSETLLLEFLDRNGRGTERLRLKCYES